jgi:hypothetical protein
MVFLKIYLLMLCCLKHRAPLKLGLSLCAQFHLTLLPEAQWSLGGRREAVAENQSWEVEVTAGSERHVNQVSKMLVHVLCLLNKSQIQGKIISISTWQLQNIILQVCSLPTLIMGLYHCTRQCPPIKLVCGLRVF